MQHQWCYFFKVKLCYIEHMVQHYSHRYNDGGEPLHLTNIIKESKECNKGNQI